MSVPHCSAWLRSWGLLRLARISPSFKRQCSMAVQEAGREKKMQRIMGSRGERETGPKLLDLAPPGPTETTQGGFPRGWHGS